MVPVILTIVNILIVVGIACSEILLSYENRDLVEQLNEQTHLNQYLKDQISLLTKQIQSAPKYTDPATTTLPTQE